MKILAIESSCDETAAAVVEDGVKELCSVVSSSKDLHEKTGGIVPEVAARKQVEYIIPVLRECFYNFAELETGKKPATDAEAIAYAKENIDALAVTAGPGLIGSLIVGVESAKALAMVWQKPLIPVNHLLGHLYAPFINSVSNQPAFPAVGLLVSGGHTDLVLIKAHGDYVYLGGTIDDAAGECFDKCARVLGLARYLGGVLVSKSAREFVSSVDAPNIKLPRPMIHENNLDFSFSGLKTALARVAEKFPDKSLVPQISHELEQAIVDVLVTKTLKALSQTGATTLIVGGGVSANSTLRNVLTAKCGEAGIKLFIPTPSLCTDNAVYIASCAFFNQGVVSLELIQANPSLGIMDRF